MVQGVNIDSISSCKPVVFVFVICEQQRRRSAAHARSLISVFVVRCLDSILPLLAKCKLSRL